MRHLEISHGAGRAEVVRVPSGWSVEMAATIDVDTATDLLTSALDAVASQGGGLLRHWVRAGDPVARRASAALGLVREREVHQLRRLLPVDQPWDVTVRPFVVGQDEQAWLAVNNRAFDWHPEQGGWTLDDVRARLDEPWFDPAGFLLHEEHGRLVGFCWTKPHLHTDPPMGEIFVIGVDPSAAGRGLGRSLTLAGLDHLWHAGLGVAMLYVDGTNAPALHLYDALGFTVHHTDTSYTTSVGAR